MNYHESYVEDLRRIRAAVPDWRRLCGRCVLITGATGLIGSAVVDFLAQCNIDEGAEIRILAREMSMMKPYSNTFITVTIILVLSSSSA